MKYPGYIPSNVNKDAKYSVVNGPHGYEVRLIYRLSAREEALLTTQQHGDLVAMVNAVKLEYNGREGGAFYINEYLDVLVPATDGGCYFAGTYQAHLEFDFDGQTISPKASPGLQPGEPWSGPHVGIRYTLKAGGRDIGYETKPSPNIVRKELLSDYHGEDAAAALSMRLARVKGEAGGRIYLNECGSFFAPPASQGEYLYLGDLDDDLWFPPPEVPRP